MCKVEETSHVVSYIYSAHVLQIRTCVKKE